MCEEKRIGESIWWGGNKLDMLLGIKGVDKQSSGGRLSCGPRSVGKSSDRKDKYALRSVIIYIWETGFNPLYCVVLPLLYALIDLVVVSEDIRGRCQEALKVRQQQASCHKP